MHPLINDLSNLTDVELENQIIDLQRKYFMTTNADIQYQITLALDSLKLEIERRRIEAKRQQEENGNSDLDNLINVS